MSGEATEPSLYIQLHLPTHQTAAGLSWRHMEQCAWMEVINSLSFSQRGATGQAAMPAHRIFEYTYSTIGRLTTSAARGTFARANKSTRSLVLSFSSLHSAKVAAHYSAKQAPAQQPRRPCACSTRTPHCSFLRASGSSFSLRPVAVIAVVILHTYLYL